MRDALDRLPPYRRLRAIRRLYALATWTLVVGVLSTTLFGR